MGDTTMFSSGVLMGDSIVTSNGTTIGLGSTFCSVSQLFGNGVLIGDAILVAYNALTTGDATPSMLIVPDDYTDYLGY
jgi:hypothetical protein